MSPERVHKATRDLVAASTSDSLPSWVTLWLMRAMVWMLSLVIPCLLTALLTVMGYMALKLMSMDRQWALTQQTLEAQQEQSTALAKVINTNTQSIARIINEDIATLNINYRELIAKGMLSKTEARLEALEAKVIRVVTELEETAPSDVKASLDEKFNEIMKRLNERE